jgi:methionine sulfoxide reductase heme-binding subunit
MIWYVARSAGIVAYLLLSSSVVLGALMAGRIPFSWPKFAVEEVHRFLAILTGVFIVIHGGSLLLDNVVPISLTQELVPFTSSYRPVTVAFGIVTTELLAAVGVSNALRKQLPHTTWRKIHYLTIPAWAFATVHGILTGTDRFDPWFAGIAGMSIAAALVAVGSSFAARSAAA